MEQASVQLVNQATGAMHGKFMLAYVSLAIGLSVITVIFAFVVTWGYLYDEIRHTAQLREEFHSTIRRLIVSIGVAVIPVVVYLIDTKRHPAYNAELYAFVWVACYVVTLLFLAWGLITLIRDAKREKKTGLYKFRR